MQFYNVKEKVFIKTLKRSGIVQLIDVENKECKITYWNDESKIIEGTFKFWQMSKFRKRDEIVFAKIDPDAKIPTKSFENGCYDVYGCFKDDYITIYPNDIMMIPTGIASSFSPKYRIGLRERGSTGSKGLSVRAGQIDSGYRNEWFVAINNTTTKLIIIANEEWIKENGDKNEAHTIYSSEKAIAQAALEIVPNVKVREITFEELKLIPSERGMGKLGSTNK
jgi:dUTP pyrophosphatase